MLEFHDSVVQTADFVRHFTDRATAESLKREAQRNFIASGIVMPAEVVFDDALVR